MNMATEHPAAGQGSPTKTFAYRGDADVEAGQPQGRARDVEKGHADAELAVTFEHPHPRRERGSHAESHEIGQRVVLDAKFAGGVGEAGDFPVQPVHEALNRMAKALPSILPCTARSMARKPVNRLAVVKRFGRIYTPRRTGFSSCIIRYLWESCEQIPAASKRR